MEDDAQPAPGQARTSKKPWDSKSQVVCLSHLSYYIKSRKLKDNTEVLEDLSRIYLIWVIGQVFTGTSSSNAHKSWLVVLRDSESLQNL
ncbi:hypothetical protein MKX03_014187, partial [Papaver bracteatum]